MLLWMKFVWVPDSTSDVLLKFSLVGVLIECRGDWGKSSSVCVLWYNSLSWDVFFFISNFCATSWVPKSLMVFLLMSVASAWTMKLWIASISACFFLPLYFIYGHEYFWFENFKIIIIVCSLSMCRVLSVWCSISSIRIVMWNIL